MPVPRTKHPPRIQIQDVEPSSTAAATPSKRRVGDRVEVYATIFKDGHEIARRGRARATAPGRRRWREVPLRRSATTARRPVRRSTGRPLEVHRRGVDRPRRHLARRAPPQGRGRPGGPRGRARRGRGAARPRVADRRGGARRRTPATGTARRRRRRSRSTSTASSRASAPGTSSSRARGAASRGVAKRAAASSPSSASTSSTCRRSTRSAARTARAGTTRSSPRAGDPGSPVGDRRRGRRPRRDPPRARHVRGLRPLVAAAREQGIEIALDFAIQCSPDHPWLNEHPEWFNRRPDGTIKYAENPPKKLPGHLQRQLRLRGLARALAGAARRRPALGRARRARSSASTTRTRSRCRSGSG